MSGGFTSIDPVGVVAVLDACVLVRVAAREVLLAFAAEGLFEPRWSERIESEWRAASLKLGRGLEATAIDGDIAVARLRAPKSPIGRQDEIDRVTEGLSLPDWDDRHVLAAAIVSDAPLIVTDNLKDFPRRRLAEHRIAPVSADEFAAALTARGDDAPLRRAFRNLAQAAAEPAEVVDLPAKLKAARLPRLAKALARRL